MANSEGVHWGRVLINDRVGLVMTDSEGVHWGRVLMTELGIGEGWFRRGTLGTGNAVVYRPSPL